MHAFGPLQSCSRLQRLRHGRHGGRYFVVVGIGIPTEQDFMISTENILNLPQTNNPGFFETLGLETEKYQSHRPSRGVLLSAETRWKTKVESFQTPNSHVSEVKNTRSKHVLT